MPWRAGSAGWAVWLAPMLRLVGMACAIVALVAGTRALTRRADGAERVRLQALQDSLRRELAVREARLDSMARAALAAADPHNDATAASLAGEARLRRAIADARAAARQDSLAMVAAIEELARRSEEQLRLQAIERQTAAERIRRLEVTVTYAPVVIGTARALVDVQEQQLDRERGRRRWWRVALTGVCYAGPVAGGAAAGALAAGPGGAAVGGVTGLAAATAACP